MSKDHFPCVLSQEFIDEAPLEKNEELTRNVNAGVAGRTRFFSHNNHFDPVKHKVSCGHAAISTLMDFYDRCPYPLKRTDRGRGNADDGNLHFPSKLVDFVYDAYPPVNFLGIKFTVRETILAAMKHIGVKAEEAYSGMGENGEYEKSTLKYWIRKHKLPVLALMDCHVLSKNVNWWDEAPGWYVLHWGFIIGYDANDVIFASWGEVKKIPWDAFMKTWKCPGLPYPNNYYAIYTYV
jgi:hypothetical protein